MAKQKEVVVDSIVDAFNAKYQKKGVTYASNISTINTRDEAGNIVYKQNEANPLLVIEAIAENIINQSVLKVVDTQFNYFKFPARTNVVVEDDLDLGIDPDDFVVEIPQPEPLPVKYSPSTDQTLIESVDFSTLEFSLVNEGPAQENVNSFTVTQEILDLIPNYLKFTGVVTSYYNSNNNSRAQFTITEFDSNGNALPASRDNGSFNIPVYYPNGTDDEGKIKKEGTYTTNINLTISKTWLQLGHTYRIMGRTNDSNNNRFHTVLAKDSYIKITGA